MFIFTLSPALPRVPAFNHTGFADFWQCSGEATPGMSPAATLKHAEDRALENGWDGGGISSFGM